MRKNRERKKYNTHPVIGALLALSLMFTAATGGVAYAVYRYASGESERYGELRERCAYEAYLSLCEHLGGAGEADAVCASEALSRCELFCELGEAEELRRAILSQESYGVLLDALEIRAGDADSGIAMISTAVKRANEAAKSLADGGNDTGGTVIADVGGAKWQTLSGKPEIRGDEAHRMAVSYLGGGVTLTQAENHSFPLVYTFTCKNAAADITRMGGRLLRMYAYRHGGAEMKTDKVCRQAAENFVSEALLRDAVILSSVPYSDSVEFTFCGTFTTSGQRVMCVDELVYVTVSRAGAVVSFFDATEYYKNKPASYGVVKIDVSKSEAAETVDAGDDMPTLIYTGGSLFWRFGGGELPDIDAETGEKRVQNPPR